MGMIQNPTMVEEQKISLEQARSEGQPKTICMALGKLAQMLVDVGQPEAAITHLNEAIDLAEANNLTLQKASYIGNRGVAWVRLKNFDQARQQFDQVEAIAAELDQPALKCDALIQRAIMHLEIPRGDLAQEDLETALSIAEQLGDLTRQMKILALLGHNHFNIASFDEAVRYFLRALELAEQSGNRLAQAGYHHNIGNIYYAADVSAEAIPHLIKAVTIFRESGDQQGEMNSLLRLVKSYADSQQPEETFETAKTGLALAKELGDRKATNSFFNLLIATSSHFGDYEGTLDLIQDALADADIEQDLERQMHLHISLGNAYFELDQHKAALDAYLVALPIAVRIQNWELETRVLGRLGAVEAEFGNLEKSIEYGNQALEAAQRVGNRRLIGEQYMMLAFGARDQGDLERAISLAEQARENFTIIEAKTAIEKLNQFIDEIKE